MERYAPNISMHKLFCSREKNILKKSAIREINYTLSAAWIWTGKLTSRHILMNLHSEQFGKKLSRHFRFPFISGTLHEDPHVRPSAPSCTLVGENSSCRSIIHTFHSQKCFIHTRAFQTDAVAGHFAFSNQSSQKRELWLRKKQKQTE
jgi:hypothetical protein